MSVAELLISSTDWANLKEAKGTSENVGAALSALLDAQTPEAASAAYWHIENHAVVQGEIFEVAEACVNVLVAAFADERPRHVRIAALELLFQILNGNSADSTLLEKCRSAAREGLWSLVREAVSGERDAAWDVLERMELGDRLLWLRKQVGG